MSQDQNPPSNNPFLNPLNCNDQKPSFNFSFGQSSVSATETQKSFSFSSFKSSSESAPPSVVSFGEQTPVKFSFGQPLGGSAQEEIRQKLMLAFGNPENCFSAPKTEELVEEKVEEKVEETSYDIDFVVSVFSESFIGITESKGKHRKVYILDISDISNVKENIISEFDIVKGEEKLTAGFSKIKLDYEGLVLNKIENTNRKVRAVCSSFKRDYPVIDRSIISDWKPYAMTLNEIVGTGNYEVIGFVNEIGVAYEVCAAKQIYLEDSEGSFQPIDTPEPEGDEYPALACWDPQLVLIPCGNCKERKYSLNGLCVNKRIFLFDLKENKFTKCVKFLDKSAGKQFVLKRFMDMSVFIPFIEGGRLRSFVLSEQKLFELYWNNDSECDELICVEHCICVSGQIMQVIATDEDFGFIVSTSKKQIVLYKPGELGKTNNDGKVRIIEKENVITPSIWCSKSKTLFERSQYYSSIPLDFEKSINLTMDEILKSEEKKDSDLFNMEEYVKEFEFACYNEPVENFTSLKKVKVDGKLNGLRSEYIYRIEQKSLVEKELEITAGLNITPTNISLPQSSHYKELELEEFVNYLGAPIVYKHKDEEKYEYASFLDLKDGKRSSNVITIGDIYSDGGSSTRTTPLKLFDYIGILTPKH